MKVRVSVYQLTFLFAPILCIAQGTTPLKDCVVEATTPPCAETQTLQPTQIPNQLGVPSERGQAASTTGVRG